MIIENMANPIINQKTNYINCTFRDMNIVETIQQVKFVGCIFTRCRLQGIKYSLLENVQFSCCDMAGMSYSELYNVKLYSCTHHWSVLVHCSDGTPLIFRDPDPASTKMQLPFADRKVMPLFLAQCRLEAQYSNELISIVENNNNCWREILHQLSMPAKEAIKKILKPYMPVRFSVCEQLWRALKEN